MESHTPKEFYVVNCPVHGVKCGDAWEQLEIKEKLYAYYFYRASWEGSMICWFQRSYESPALFVLLQIVFSQDIDALKEAAINEGISEEEWKQFCAYSAAVFNNCGNYKSFGDTKFLPELSSMSFWTIVKVSRNYTVYQEVCDKIWESISLEVYSETPPYYKIGFSNDDENSSYYSSNITKEDATMVDNFMKSQKISPLNTRLEKDGTEFEVKLASSKKVLEMEMEYLKSYDYEGNKIKITRGDFDAFMDAIILNLSQAKNYTANETQRQMIENYIINFETGNMEYHKNAMKNWISDVGPTIETNIGYIETYLDPLGVRAEYEGFVSIVDKEISKMFSKLVENAEALIKYLPWDKAFEKDKFNKPDFTSLNVLAFACSGTPIGINLPNYDDVRENLGYKNVDLTNVYPKLSYDKIQYLKDDAKEIYYKYEHDAMTLLVALHELLGHGTGKLLTKDVETGRFNFDYENVLNPFTGEKITSYYMSNETWSSKFGKLHSGYEECRADSVALYLAQYEEPYQIFFKDRQQEWFDIRYVMWLDMIKSGIGGLVFYDEKTQQFTQAHIIASFVIMRVLYNEGDIFDIEFTQKDGKDYFYINLEPENVEEKCFQALKPFLNKLHVLKCMGDFDQAQSWFGEYMKVDDNFLKLKKIVIENRLPRRLEVQPNLFMTPYGDVEYKDYDTSHEGIIRSYVERFPDLFHTHVYDEWVKNMDKYRIKL